MTKYNVPMQRTIVQYVMMEIEADDVEAAIGKASAIREMADWSTTDTDYDEIDPEDVEVA
jgi:hypothetical protein